MWAHDSTVEYMEDDLRAQISFAVASLDAAGGHVHPLHRVHHFKMQTDAVWEHLVSLYAFDFRACLFAVARHTKELALGGQVARCARDSVMAVLSQFERAVCAGPAVRAV